MLKQKLLSNFFLLNDGTKDLDQCLVLVNVLYLTNELK